MARTLSTQDISWFLDLNEKNQLNLNPPYQRRSVWSPKDKRFFIDTILNGYPAPPIFLHKTLEDSGRPTYHVVDGKQRLQTIIEFSQGNLRIPDDFSDIELQKKRWKDLDRTVREQFWNYILIVEMLPDASEVSIKNIFERINRNSRKLMPQELRHAKYDGWFIVTAEAESEKQEWKDFGLVTTARTKRMADVQFISELLSLMIKSALQGFDHDALDDIYAEFEDLADQPTFVEEDFQATLEQTKAYVRALLALEPELMDFIKVQNHFYTLWGYLIIESSRLLPVEEFAPKYKAFLNDVMTQMNLVSTQPQSAPTNYELAVIKYANNTRGASTDLTPRLERHSALVTVLHSAEAVADEN